MDKITLELGNSAWSRGFRHKTRIAVLGAVTLAIGIYLVSSKVLIAKDGILYIEIAQKMAVNTPEAVRGTGQPPGYPFLIYVMHQLVGIFYGSELLGGWIISAQAVSLLSKLGACLAIYFIGSYLVGSRVSFWGVLILSLLPDAVDFGSDALSDWPSLMFLSVGFLLLLLGAEHRKSWMWGLAGLVGGGGLFSSAGMCTVGFIRRDLVGLLCYPAAARNAKRVGGRLAISSCCGFFSGRFALYVIQRVCLSGTVYMGST